MKQLLILIFAGLLFFGCSKKSGEKQLDSKTKYQVDTTAIKAKPVSNPNESFNIAYKFEKGKHYTYRLSSISHDEQLTKVDTTISQKMDQSVIYILDVSLIDKDNEGIREMNCDITSTKLDAQVNGQEYRFESGTTKDTLQIEKFAEYYAVANNPFSVRIGSNGGVLEVFKTDKIVDKYIKARRFKRKLTSDQKDQLSKSLVQGFIKPIIAQVFREVTPRKLAKDSTWSVEKAPQQYMIFNIENTDKYKINNLEMYNNDKLAVIDAGLDSKVTGKTKVTQRGIEYNFKKPSPTTSGKIYFNLTKGCIQKSKINTGINMFFTMEGNTPKGRMKGSKSEKINSTNTVELL